MPQYMLLIHEDERNWQQLSDEERNAVYEEYFALSRDMRARDVYLGGNELAPTTSATTVRVRDSETLVTDGPFAETKEHLGGYYLIQCNSLDEAIEWAARIPTARNGSIEVRPVIEH